MGRLNRTLETLLRLTSAARSAGTRTSPRSRTGSEARPTPRPARRRSGPVVEYAVEVDGRPDPGEVVWAWVPYEEDPTQGKDRPVLLLAHEGTTWFGLMLTSRDHTRDPSSEARHGRHWMDVGTGGWDRARRPSEVRLDRLLRLDESAIRREGSALDRRTFDAVVARARQFHALG